MDHVKPCLAIIAGFNLPLLTLLLAVAFIATGCGMRDNEIGYRMAVEEGWETAVFEPTGRTADCGWMRAGDIRVVKVNTLTGDSCEYITHGLNGKTWIKKPFTFWDQDLAIYRALYPARPTHARGTLERFYNVDHRGRDLAAGR